MLKIVAILALPIAISSAQDCFKYGAAITVEGTLALRDEAGYNKFIVLKPSRPICAEVDPKTVDDPKDDYYRGRDGVREVQAGVYGSDSVARGLRERLEVLTGHRVFIKGDLFPARTGYHRTPLQLRVQQVEPADAEGRQALVRPRVPFIARDVAAYDVTIQAGPRLIIEVREIGTESPLTPGDQYAPHWMTGGEVVYVACRDGYNRKLVSSTDREGICSDRDLCGFSAFPKKPVAIKFRCTKKR